MTCTFVVSALAVAPSVRAQVIDEGGFPVKGAAVSSAAFSLSCPPRLVAQAGESISLSCAATGVSEEGGVHYEWRSLSGDDLRLLSDAQSQSPFFTAPVSGGREYAYRLTATGPGVYASASVTVTVQGVSGESGRGPGLQDECDPLAIPDEFGEGCVPWEREPAPFGFGFEEDEGFLFPDAAGLPDRGGGFDSQAPPRLDCPAAVFLEELETGRIECHAWDAAGEEHLDYSWEPVGSTTRDYLDNPRLIPEDSPHPSVIAPEAPVYETLESFHSGETTLRYRYRLTATSRATGLFSSSEVEVYVSSSRPGVYCPPEVVVQEGETVALDCEGVDPLSFRMDYDEDEASVLWEWEGLWGTSTAPLAATDLSSPLFTAPPGSAGAEYHYIASMTTSASGAPQMARRRVTVRVTDAEEGIPQGIADVNASASMSGLSCPEPYLLFVGDPSFTVGCSGRESEVNSIEWHSMGGASSDEYDEALLSSRYVRYPTLSIPASLPESVELKKLDYTVVFSLRDTDGFVTGKVMATVLNRAVLRCSWPHVQEGDDDIQFDCEVTDGPSGVEEYTYAWEARSDTPNTDLLVDGTDTPTPTFSVPDDIDEDKNYRYWLIASAAGFHPAKAMVTVRVKDTDIPDAVITCNDPDPVYEGAADITLDCSVENEPSDATYAWTARGSTSGTDDLSSTTILKPTFDVPDDIDESGGADKDYEYTVTMSASGVDDVTEDVTVTVLEKPDIGGCPATSSAEIWEGDADLTVGCELWSGAPGVNPVYTYRWTARGGTTDMERLRELDKKLTEFHAPEDVADGETEIYEYRLTASAENADAGTLDYTATVKDKPNITVTCADSPYEVYEGDADIELECEASGRWESTTFTPLGTWYTWQWSPRTNLTGDQDIIPGDKENDTSTPTFAVPDDVDQDTTYTYTVTASAAISEDGTAEVRVTVRDTDSTDPSLTCTDSEVYEGTADIILDCSVTNEPSGATYAWTARGSTANTDNLSSTTILKPTFSV
ncbi:MAG: hypothetical protein F4Z69_06055, partial [Bacteroidetes bacterium SB0668_bin_1]|nr:hypothetical protein [Bacteroidetes bacterium SB0668_bin_1]